jgi:23S rRNA (uracil1939-C5)-methyltransferase
MSALPHKGARVVVRIEGMDDEGRGRGLLFSAAGDDERVDVAVRGAFPGDEVEAVVERAFPARRLVTARVLRLLFEGHARVGRTCPHPPPCVGCPLDGLDPSLQLALKRERVLFALADVGLAHVEVDDVLPAPARTGYRQKTKLAVGGQPGSLKLGLYAPWSHFVVDTTRCATHHPSLVPALAALRDVLDGCRLAPFALDPAGLKAVVLRAFYEGPGAVVVCGAPLSDDAWRALQALVSAGHLAQVSERVDAGRGNSVVGGALGRSCGPALLTPLEGGPPAPVDAFCQPDPVQARALYDLVAAFAADGGQHVLDAYAGTGGFARAVRRALPTATLTAIERAEPCLEALRALGATVLGEEVGSAIGKLQTSSFDTVIADPPKKGLGDDGAALAALAAVRFALVSCDPDAMARDLALLMDAGYRPLRVLPIDLFAGTPEVEVLTLLERLS